jgi:hypothetical protein
VEIGAVIGYAVVFLVGLIVGRVWGGAAASRGRSRGNMLAPRLSPTAMPSNAGAGVLPDAPFEEEVRRLVAAGKLIEAIKLYRARTGCGLKEAKDAVERIAGRYQ